MEDGSNFYAELLLASPALVPLLVSKPDEIADLTTTDTERLTIGPAHLRYLIDANLLIAKVLNGFYESSGVCHEQTIGSILWFVKYISTSIFLLFSDICAI